ncbi:hypothetical protein ONE63_003017 [Megalurothrips usitatus]|uniref:Aldehyde dehydrogenase n=1 Tax=Megalurothrips usitatus TaxID=439358 RepID=A0AAV7X9P9_9NEOP|nr:hypothetical protein ONE63_003017 [Megalurothrips usitatus]
MKPEKPTRAPLNWFDEVVIHKEPLGVVLVLGTWNYPLHLTLLPVAGAIAAGNCVIIKPPDLVPESARAMAELIPRYLDKDCVQVLLGGIPETTEILRQKFDYIFYTGSANVGRIVHAAANRHLTPTTLELGGKSPVWLGASADLLTATRRLLWGKFTNMGQTCVAPDYLLCTREVRDDFLRLAKQVIEEFYGADPKASPDLGRIVSDRQFQRVNQLLKCGTVAVGGDVDRADLYVGPTILVDVLPDDPVMAEEVFGPVLPVYTVAGPTEAVNFINSRDKPLALYVFTRDPEERDMFLSNTSSGGVSVNDTMLHLCTEGLPFGGVGLSGMGAYHGRYSFETFSHRKGVLAKNFNPVLEAVAAARYPPYSRHKTLLLRTLMLKRRSLPWRTLASAGLFSLGMAFTWALNLLTAGMTAPPETATAAAAAVPDT